MTKKPEKAPPPALADAPRGHPVKVEGTKGYWKLMHYSAEKGEVTVYGGSNRDPNGRLKYRTFTEDRITVL